MSYVSLVSYMLYGSPRSCIRVESRTGSVSGERLLTGASTRRWRIGPFDSVVAARRFVMRARDWLSNRTRPSRDDELAYYLNDMKRVLDTVDQSKSVRQKMFHLLRVRMRSIITCKYDDDIVAPARRDEIMIVHVE